MARLFNGTTDSAAASVDLSSQSLIALAFWLWWDAYGTDNKLCFEFTSDGTAAGTQGFTLDPNAGDGTFFFWMAGSAGSNTQRSFARLSAAAWHHYLFNLDANTPATTVYGDGSPLSLTDVLSTAGGAFTSDSLYFMSRTASTLLGAGRLAEVGLWRGVNLSASEAAALAIGYSPLLIRPTSLSYYWPLLGRTSPERELRQGATATLNSTAVTEHPRIVYPSPYHPRRFTTTTAVPSTTIAQIDRPAWRGSWRGHRLGIR